MAALERVMQLKNEGQTEPQMIDTLKQEGFSPKDIYDALTQSTIKSELSQTQMPEQTQTEMPPEQTPEGYYPPQVQQEGQYPPYSETSGGYPQTPQDYSQQYPQYQEYQSPQPATDIETINEIAEQVVEEKTAELKKTISEIKNFKEETKSNLERINKKIERIENNFNELQVAILRRIGEYGENIKNIATEMHETQDSFSKILNPLTDNIRELQKMTGDSEKTISKPKQKEEIQEETEENQEPRRTTKPEPGFETYLR